MRRRILHGLVFTFAAHALAASVGGTIGPRAHAQGDSGFVELSAIPAVTLEGDVLFLPLDESFQGCVPLSRPCPADSSTLLLVPAEGRRIAWTPEGVDLPGSARSDVAVPAVGMPPAAPATARFLAPVLDGRGAALVHLERRFSDGALVDDGRREAPADEPSEEPYLPHLQGPALSTVAPAPSVPQRLVSTPAVADAEELVDAVAVLLARRAAPSRVVFGIEADPAWGLSQRYVALIERDGLAVVARRGDEVGLAVPADAGTRIEPTAGVGPGGGTGADGRSAAIFAIAAASVAAVAAIVVVHRRRRRSVTGR